MEANSAVNFKARLQRLIAYQDVFARNNLLAQRSCDQGLKRSSISNFLFFFFPFESIEFSAFLKFHNDLRRKYADLRTYSDELDRYVEQYRTELARKEKKIQSQSSQILRLTQHNKRSNERLNELQRCLDQIKGTITGQNTFDQLRDILRLVRSSFFCLLSLGKQIFFSLEIQLCQIVKQRQIYQIKIVPAKNSISMIMHITYRKLSVNRQASEASNGLSIQTIKMISNVRDMTM